MKVKEPESISSVLGQIKQEEKRNDELMDEKSDDLQVNMKFKTRREKIVWLTDELRKEFERAFDETASKWNKKRAKQ